MKKQYKNIDEYIGTFPPEVQAVLEKVRQTIHDAAPTATEAIAYGIPTFKLNGNLVHFGGFKNHVGFYPAPKGIEAFKKELAQYLGGKGTIQFPLDKPIPFDLITRIVKLRVTQNENK